MAENIEYAIRLLEQDDKVRKSLSHGDEKFIALRRFLESDAKKHHLENLSKTYVCVANQNKVVGYITITCSQIKLDGTDVPDALVNFRHEFPAVKIGRLLICQSIRRSGIGKSLVSIAISAAKDNVAPSVGCRFVIVDAHQDAIKFYRDCGFTLLSSEENKTKQDPIMFLDIGKLQ